MRILLVEDNAALSGFINDALTQHGYSVDLCDEGDDGLRWMLEGVHDLVLLDRMLPRLDGLSLLSMARKAGIHTPVLMLTALGDLPQIVEGLNTGADDYLVKPFALDELLARIAALTRRPRGLVSLGKVTFGGLCLDLETSALHCGNKSCTVSKRECSLLEILMRNPGQTVTRRNIFTYVWGPDAAVEDANLDNYIHFVRDRLAEVRSPVIIETVRGVGYRLEQSHVS
ncbi:MAG: response regulator transcription factor [Oscillospiraceae bacterium]|nr:response regulator transcription factor [Oscillospiraceae bacterium]